MPRRKRQHHRNTYYVIRTITTMKANLFSSGFSAREKRRRKRETRRETGLKTARSSGANKTVLPRLLKILETAYETKE